MNQDCIPDCPAYLTTEEYQYVIQRSGHDCALRAQCHSGRCSRVLNFDHIHPRALGGDDSFVNQRLLCESPNKGRPLEPSEYWSAPNFWDKTIRETYLREVQRLAGYDAVIEEPAIRTALRDFRDQLLQTVTLLPGATGIGKAVLTQGVFFAINKVIGPNRPRIRHVLWLTVDTTLRDSTASELANDLVAHGIIDERPRVRKLDGYDDFLKGNLDYDVCVACPHSVWEVRDGKKETGLRRGSNEIRDALRHFDAIVFDEVDWASEQVQGISQVARHALKFSLTASPPLSDEKFAQRCVLLSTDAIADYKRAVELDGCLKIIQETEVIPVASHDGFSYLSSGVLGTAEKSRANPDFPVYLAAILDVASKIDRLESSMRQAIPERYYSPHIIVRLPRIEDIEAIYKTLPGRLQDLGLENPGWGVAAVFQGHQRRLKLLYEESNLSARDGNGNWIHPFMRAKNNLGRADHKCKRILLMCNIGLRGINNWPILAVLDLYGGASEADDIQLKGRGTRLPNHLRSLHGEKALEPYITLRYCIADTSDREAKEAEAKEARDFILTMRERFIERQFCTWIDIAEGTVPASRPAKINPGDMPLTPVDRIRIQNRLGLAVTQGNALDDELIERIIGGGNGNGGGPSPARIERERQYARRLVDNPKFALQELFGDDHPVHIESVMVKLKPKTEYSQQELVTYIKDNPDFRAHVMQYQEAIERGDFLVAQLISKHLRDEQTRLYREPGRTFTLQDRPDGVLVRVAGELASMLLNSGAIDKDHFHDGSVQRFVNVAACEIFNIEHADNNGRMDQHPYHVAIQGRLRRPIQSRARYHLARKGLLPGLSALANYYAQSSSESE